FIAYLFWPSKSPVPSAYGAAKVVVSPSSPKKPLSERFAFLEKIKEFFKNIIKKDPKQAYRGI
ncbi:MAG: hypothetical protein V1944_01470, partial [Candidatus Aenigmatarchaeota archaeon]